MDASIFTADTVVGPSRMTVGWPTMNWLCRIRRKKSEVASGGLAFACKPSRPGTVSGNVVADGDSEKSGEKAWSKCLEIGSGLAAADRGCAGLPVPSGGTIGYKTRREWDFAPPPLIPTFVLQRLTHSCNNQVSNVSMGQEWLAYARFGTSKNFFYSSLWGNA